MKTLNIKEITSKLKEALNIDDVALTDDSHLHQSHQQFQASKAYLTVCLAGETGLSRISLHRKIMRIVNQVCNIPVHAIAIKVKAPK